MHSYRPQRQLDRPGFSHTFYGEDQCVWDYLQQPSIIVPILVIVLTLVYRSLHSSPLSYTRHPGEVLWDFIIAITPAKLLYALDDWLHPPMFPIAKPSALPSVAAYDRKSDALRRILGVDRPDSIFNSVAHASRKSISALSGSTSIKRNVQQPPGLGNYDNSCFQNSILQALSSLTPLPAYLDRASEGDKTARDNDASSANSLRSLISKLAGSANNGTTLWTPKKLKSLDTWQQQDAQEYFSKILDEIDKEVAKAVKEQHRPSGLEITGVRDDSEDSQHSDDSGYQSMSIPSKASSDSKISRNPLEGLVAQRVACTQCGHSEGLSMVPFNCLTFNLGTDGMRHDLYERLDAYAGLEAIQGVECAKCSLLKVKKLLEIIVSRGRAIGASDNGLQEPLARLEAVELALEEDDFGEKTLTERCKISAQHRASSTKTKQVAIARPPQSLAIHMNRSVFDERTGAMFKNPAPVQFPRTLDLGPWCLGSASGQPATQAGGSTDTDGKGPDPVYELRAVITHQGRHENGHYVCFRKHPSQPPKLEDTDDQDAGTGAAKDRSSSLPDDRTPVGAEAGDARDADLDPDPKWWRLSDESAWEVSEEQVLSQGGVFMLFYDCVDPNSVLVSEVEAEEELRSRGMHNDVAIVRDDRSETAGMLEHSRPHARPHGPAFSSLHPSLADGERVDPIIPLHRPNR